MGAQTDDFLLLRKATMVNTIWDNIFKRAEKQNDLILALKKNPLFENLSQRELMFIKDLVHIRQHQPGEIIFKQGEMGIGMYIIMNGTVDIYIEDSQEIEKEPVSIHVTRLVTGDFFGELALVEDKGRRTASAIAQDETRLIGFFKPELVDIVERNPRTGVQILMRLGEILGRRLKETADKVTRLRRELQSLSDEGPK